MGLFFDFRIFRPRVMDRIVDPKTKAIAAFQDYRTVHGDTLKQRVLLVEDNRRRRNRPPDDFSGGARGVPLGACGHSRWRPRTPPAWRHQLVLLDLSLPDSDRDQTFAGFTRGVPHLPILLLSAARTRSSPIGKCRKARKITCQGQTRGCFSDPCATPSSANGGEPPSLRTRAAAHAAGRIPDRIYFRTAERLSGSIRLSRPFSVDSPQESVGKTDFDFLRASMPRRH